jgi:hypothetical protein
MQQMLFQGFKIDALGTSLQDLWLGRKSAKIYFNQEMMMNIFSL